jgi:hypothetical protein
MEQTERLVELVTEIDRIVDTAVSDPTLEDADSRRLLRFISQVIQVVEQAFQDVLSLLIEIKLLQESDLHSSKMVELRKNAELLTSRSYYRDAAEICSRLKHLRANFDEFIRPSVSHLPNFSDWQGVFGLIEHREGRIIMLVEQSVYEISDLLDRVDSGNLDSVKNNANQYAEELRSLLKELRELTNRILGFSGHAGFLELTTNRSELQREVKLMVDKSITHGHRVSMGTGNTFKGTL